MSAKAGDVFTITGYEDGSPSTAEHARVDYIEFIPMGAMSKQTDDVMKMMGVENATPAMVAESDYAMATV